MDQDDQQHRFSELLALIAENQDFWARRALAAAALEHNLQKLETTLRKLQTQYSMWRRDSRDYVGYPSRNTDGALSD